MQHNNLVKDIPRKQETTHSSILHEYQYVGWIPCVTGQICYSFAESSFGKENSCQCFNKKIIPNDRNSTHRRVILTSEVDWKDRKDHLADGDWQVIVIAETNIEKELMGDVYIVPVEKRNSITEVLEDFRTLRSNYEDDEFDFDKLSSKLKSKIDGNKEPELYRISFKVAETGLTYLKVIKGGDGQEKENDDYVLCRQSFYYLKYSLHRHKHHPNSLDSLVTIHPTTLGSDRIGKTLIFDSKQSLIDIKREQDHLKRTIEFNFLGIASYMRSLLEACKKDKLISDPEYAVELIYIRNTEESYRALSDKKEKLDSYQSGARIEARQVILLFFAILAPWVITSKQLNGQSSDFGNLLLDVYADGYKSIAFIAFIALVFIIYFAYYLVVCKYSSFANIGTKMVRSITEIVSEKKKAYILFSVLFIIGAIAVVATLRNIFGL